MSVVVEILQAVGVFAGGLVARFGLFLVMALAVVLPAIVIAVVVEGARRRRERKLGLKSVAGVQYRPGVLYAPGHTWLQARGADALELGIDDLAQRLLPSVTAVELPRAGSEVKRGDVVATLFGGGREVKIRAPIPGVIVGVNAATLRDPGLVKREGYSKGWLVAISPLDQSWRSLPRGALAETWIARESNRWNRFLEEQLQFAAADGGELIAPAPWLIGEQGWKALAGAFLTV